LFDPITAGIGAIGAGSSILGSLFGSQNNANTNQSWLSQANALLDMQQNSLRQRQMNLDAERRKRDIIRSAQVATAKAENSAANSGAINSSGIEGARAGISGQAGVNYLGVSQNQEIGNQMFGLANQQAQMGMMAGYQRASQRTNMWDILNAGSFAFQGQNGEQLGKVAKWGFGVISGT
jgi:hypothetical protein